MEELLGAENGVGMVGGGGSPQSVAYIPPTTGSLIVQWCQWLRSDIHCPICTEATLSVGCSQAMTECSKDIGLSLRDSDTLA